MKGKLSNFRAALILGVSLTLVPFAQGQWLTHTTVANPPPNTQQTTAHFAGAAGGYVGTVTATASNVATTGIPGISPNPFTNVTTGPGSFAANYPLNPGGTFDFLNINYNHVSDTFTVTFSFSGLSLGVLPPGAVIAFLDVDNFENVTNISATDSQGHPISSSWLLQLPTATNLFDYDAAPGGLTPGQEAVFTQPTGGVYDLTGQFSNQDSAFQGFRTNRPIKSLSFTFTDSSAVAQAGSYGIAIEDPQFVAVPEPSAMNLAELGCAALILLAGQRASRLSPRRMTC